MSDEKVTVHIQRLNPGVDAEPHWQVFDVPYEHRHSVLTLLHYIYENYDPTLGYRPYTCGRGLCNSCQVSVNGKVRKGCAMPIPPGSEIRLAPCNKDVIRDLATVLHGGPAEPAVLEERRHNGGGAA